MASTFTELLDNFYSSELFGFDSTTGQIIPQTSDVKTNIESLMNAIFDQTLSLDAETPAGRLVEAWTMMITRFCAVTATYANQINPQYATGQMLDALGALFSIERTGSTKTIIICDFQGKAGTVIPAGSRISNQAGDEFEVQSQLTLNSSGKATGFAVSTVSGPLDVEAGTVNNILDSVVGWNYVNNIGIQEHGVEIESDEHYRNRILNARWTGTGFVESIKAQIEREGKATSVIVVDNGENKDMYLNSEQKLVSEVPPSEPYLKLAPNSMLAIVYGGDGDDIAGAIIDTKPAGCGYTSLDEEHQDGIEKGIVEEKFKTVEGMTYPVIFNRPLLANFGVKIVVGRNKYTGTTDTLKEEIKSAITKWALGEAPFTEGISLGQSIYSFEIGAAVSDLIPSIQIRSVKILLETDESDASDTSDTSDSDSSDTPSVVEKENLELFINEIAVLDNNNIEIEII